MVRDKDAALGYTEALRDFLEEALYDFYLRPSFPTAKRTFFRERERRSSRLEGKRLHHGKDLWGER